MRVRAGKLLAAWGAGAALLLGAPAGSPGADLQLELTPEWAGQPIGVPSAGRPNAAGQQLRLTRCSLLLSDFALRRPDGSFVYLTGHYGLVDAAAGRTVVALGEVPAGAYTGLTFRIGLDPAIDHGAAGQWPAGHPLNPLADGLYWGWQGGYVFAALEGTWQDQAGPARGFSFHLAAGAGPMIAQLGVPFTVRGPLTVHCAWDLAGLLRPLRFTDGGATSSTHSRPGDPLAAWLGAAAGRAVGWRGATATPSPFAAADPAPSPAKAEVPFVIPTGFPQPELPADNPLTAAGIALGHALFSDPRLSGTGRQSCASCHDPAHAYADPAPVSTGATGALGARHSPSLLNLAWQPAFAWDGSQRRIRDQALRAMASPSEMHADLTAVAAQLGADPARRQQFQAAFGTAAVTPERLGLALEQYLLTLVAADSRFDRAAQGRARLTAQEQRGLMLFVTEYDPARGQYGADCFHCHGGALFGDFAYRDNGLGASAADRGRGAVTGEPADDGKFKTPSLRNVALRAPYMHDGRFPDLAAAVAHYVRGVQRTANLDPNLGKHPDAGMALSAADQAALVAFLRTLTSVPST